MLTDNTRLDRGLVLQAGVQDVPQLIPQDVKADDGDHYRDAGDKGEAGAVPQVLLAGGDHVAPLRHGRGDAHPQVAEGGNGDNGGGDPHGGGDDDHRQAVFQDVDKEDPGVLGPQGPGSHNIVLLLDLEGPAPYHSGKGGDGPDADSQHGVKGVYPQHGDNKHCQQDAGEGKEQVHHPHNGVIQLGIIGGQQAADGTHHKTHGGGNKAYQKGDPAPVQKPGVNIPPVFIGAQVVAGGVLVGGLGALLPPLGP